MRKLWSLNGIRKIVGLEPALKDTFKKMWSEKELKELEIKIRYGENVWNEVKDDVILSGMKRLYTKKDIMRLVQTWNLGTPDLEGKEYLGNGEYLVVDDSRRKYYYNVYSGIWTIEGGGAGIGQTVGTNIFINSFPTNIDYVVSVNFIVPLTSGLLSFQTSSDNTKLNGVSSGYNEFILDKNSDILYIKDAWSSTDGAKFTLKIEKGDTATPLNMFGGKSYDEMINEGLITLQYDNQGHLDYMLNKDLINEEEYDTYSKEIEKKEVI